MIPHEEKKDIILTYPKDLKKNSPTINRRIVISTADLVIAIVLTCGFIASLKTESLKPVSLYFGIGGSVSPDIIVISSFVFDNRFLRWFFKKHNEIHFLLSCLSVSRKKSLMMQVFLSICFITASKMAAGGF